MESIATRKLYFDFVDYLTSVNKCKEVWVCEEIEAEYKNFQISRQDVDSSGNNFLLAASRLVPPLLRHGSIVRLLFGFEKLSTSESELDKCETSRSCPDSSTAVSSFNLKSGETDHNILSSRIGIDTVNDVLSNGSFKPVKVQLCQLRERYYPETSREKTRKTIEKDLSVADQTESWRARDEQNGSDNLSFRKNSKTIENGSWREPNKAIDSGSDLLMISRVRDEADHKSSWRQPCRQIFPEMVHEISHTKKDEKLSEADHNELWRGRNEQNGSDSNLFRFPTNDELVQNRSWRNEQNEPHPPRSRTITAADHNSSWRRPSEQNYQELLSENFRTKSNKDLSPGDMNGSWRVANEQNDTSSRSLRAQMNDQNSPWHQPTKRNDQEIQQEVSRTRNKKDPFTAHQNGSWSAPYKQNGPDSHSWRSQMNNEADQKASSTESHPDLSKSDHNISWREMSEQNYAYSQKPSTKYEYSMSESDHNPSWRRGNDQNHVDDLKRRRSQAKRVVQGVKPKVLNGGEANETRKLAAYEVDEETEMSYEFGMLSKNPLLKGTLSPQNYTEKFHLLLNIEDLHNLDELEQFTIESTALLKNPNTSDNLRCLDIPENGPSLLIGDRVYATPCNPDDSNSDVEFEGFVHVVENQQILLGFKAKGPNALPAGRNVNFRVRFTLNRRPIRFMHNALDNLCSVRLKKMLFPHYPPEPYDPKSKLLIGNSKIASNDEQRTAVENIVLGKTPPIYIIFGPPGTGKTVTMVEAIFQTYKRFNHNILVCALCNDACDMLTLKLLDCDIDKSKIMRVYGASRSWKKVPSKIKEGRTNYVDGQLYMPSKAELMRYRIIVCTFVTAGRISLMDFPDDYFQRVFVDESGQAFEPECLIAVSGILAKNGKLVLAGDPKQLGPIVKSKLAKKHGLQRSLLQRLMDTCSIYQKDRITGKYNHQCVTKLVRNYRSHEAILSISNQHFYDGDLLVCADESERAMMCGWEWLKNKDFPIIFHGVEGQQTRDESSPSYYNPAEIMIVKDYVNKLTRSRRHQLILAKQIGIVTPYKMQCKKIQEAVATYGDIDVGSVEVFQGQERLVIIISTVRSSDERISDNPFHHLGFLCDPRRFNVALTRAKALLIIVGNPRLLSLDKYWRSLLKYCMENNAYCGVKLSSTAFDGANDVKEIKELFQKLDIVTQHECDNVDDDFIDPIR